MVFNCASSEPGIVVRLMRATTPWVAGMLFALFSATAGAEPRFSISSVKVDLVDKVYYLSAQVDLELSDQILEVMHKGVPVVVQLDIEFQRSRKYLWDDEVAQLVQRYRLVYHALTRQYLVTNLNSGSQHSFPTLEVALTLLGTVVDLPVLDRQLVEEEGEYLGRMRASVDVTELPTPLRLRAIFSSDWHLSSEWYSWILPD